MSLPEDNTNRTYKNFRTSLDVGMGMLYVGVGFLVLYAHYFGSLALSATYAYIFGGLMLAYGAFRIYRGLIVIFRNRKHTNIPPNR
jgi:hypothetical protein